MAEYLAPGVYVEETPSNKPIEGVSTSTAGFVGVTERGPVNAPQLLTSVGEYRRLFGDLLPQAAFTEAGRCHGYLPHAVEGFFTNGGKRCYVTRVLPEDAERAHTMMFHADPTVTVHGQTVLLRAAAQATGAAGSPPRLYALDPANFGLNDWVRVGDGSRAEFHRVAALGASAHVSMAEPLSEAHAQGATTQLLTLTANVNFDNLELKADAAAGATSIRATGADVGNLVVGTPAVAARRLLMIGSGAALEVVYAASIALDGAGPDRVVTLSRPLSRAHASGTTLTSPDAAAAAGTLSVAANAGDCIVFGPDSDDTTQVLVLERGSPVEEARPVGRLATLPLATGAYADYVAGTTGVAMNAAVDQRTVRLLNSARRVPLASVADAVVGGTLTHGPDTRTIVEVNTAYRWVALDVALPAALAEGDAVTLNPGAAATTVDVWPTRRWLPLAESAGGIRAGMAVTLDPPGADTATVATVQADVGLVELAADFPGAAVLNAGTVMRIGGSIYTLREFDSTDVVALDRVDGLAPGQQVTIGGSTRAIAAVNTMLAAVRLQTALPALPADGAAVTLDTLHLNAAAGAGAATLSLDNRMGLAVGDVLRIGTAPDDEFVSIARILGDRNAAPDAGAVQLGQALQRAHASGATVQRQLLAPVAGRQAAALVLGAARGAGELLVADGSGYAPPDLLRIDAPDGSRYYHALSASAINASPQEITLDGVLLRSHPAGAALAEREPLFTVQALDRGDWGNRLEVSVRVEDTGLVANATVLAANPPPGPGMFSSLQLTTVTGVEPGTILELLAADGTPVAGAPLLKVRAVDRATRLVLLDPPGLQPIHIVTVAAALMAGQPARVRSREFSLSVYLLQRPDAAVPARNGTVIDQEVFRHLSLDMRHSRYIEHVIGVTFPDGVDTDDRGQPVRRSDRRSEGSSTLIRVLDLAPDDAARTALRISPEPLTDTLPSDLTRAARQPLAGGDDAVTQMNDAMYLGADSNEPTHRTGLQTLKNLQTVSLVAVPGQTTAPVQQALIDHCEAQRYRFAVLDGPPPTNDTVADVQLHRAQYDTRYAALYHPWLTIDDPFPASTAGARELALPPSGHVLGLYARVDNERGVHKAPANEVLRGIGGLARYFNRGEQDILNPYPVHINVIRDFRPNNRGLRVWGARCITSDAEYKYVNVRRLLIFLEDSIDRGLQWVVFEPNAEPLWARVRRSVSNFLTTVWRNGALEGASVEQAFFVKCDRTTMTRDDLDNGRLVCVIGVAPVKPAEFVIVRIGLWTADAKA